MSVSGSLDGLGWAIIFASIILGTCSQGKKIHVYYHYPIERKIVPTEKNEESFKIPDRGQSLPFTEPPKED